MGGNYKHGMRYTRIYNIWRSMRQRCNNPKCVNYHNYGGRGIRVCDEWNNSFLDFYDWAMSHGYTDFLTLDRKDTTGDYCPENCRWASQKTQQNNKSSNRIIEFNGVAHTLAEWSDITGIGIATIWDRLHRGWDVQKTLTQIPVVGSNQYRKGGVPGEKKQIPQ